MRLPIISLFGLLFLLLSAPARAQFEMRGLEIGPWAGTSFYLGDLNTEFRFNRPNLAAGFAARYNFNHRLAVRGSFNYGRVEAYDSDSENTFERNRNLDFWSNIFDLTSQFEFNFLPYYHGSPEYFFTPYAFVGVSVFRFSPMTVNNEGRTVPLRNFGTEGQALGDEYSRMSTALAYGVGIRWDLSYAWSMDAHLSIRNTRTDYLDDVSTFYPDFSQLNTRRGGRAVALSDRAVYKNGEDRSVREGTQRGDASLNDHYLFLGLGLNYYFGDIRCPTIEKSKRGRRAQKKRQRSAKQRSKRQVDPVR